MVSLLSTSDKDLNFLHSSREMIVIGCFDMILVTHKIYNEIGYFWNNVNKISFSFSDKFYIKEKEQWATKNKYLNNNIIKHE